MAYGLREGFVLNVLQAHDGRGDNRTNRSYFGAAIDVVSRCHPSFINVCPTKERATNHQPNILRASLLRTVSRGSRKQLLITTTIEPPLSAPLSLSPFPQPAALLSCRVVSTMKRVVKGGARTRVNTARTRHLCGRLLLSDRQASKQASTQQPPHSDSLIERGKGPMQIGNNGGRHGPGSSASQAACRDAGAGMSWRVCVWRLLSKPDPFPSLQRCPSCMRLPGRVGWAVVARVRRSRRPSQSAALNTDSSSRVSLSSAYIM